MRAVCANEEPARVFAEYENARGRRDVSLAQQAERTEFNGEVAGSSPSGYQLVFWGSVKKVLKMDRGPPSVLFGDVGAPDQTALRVMESASPFSARDPIGR